MDTALPKRDTTVPTAQSTHIVISRGVVRMERANAHPDPLTMPAR